MSAVTVKDSDVRSVTLQATRQPMRVMPLVVTGTQFSEDSAEKVAVARITLLVFPPPLSVILVPVQGPTSLAQSPANEGQPSRLQLRLMNRVFASKQLTSPIGLT